MRAQSSGRDYFTTWPECDDDTLSLMILCAIAGRRCHNPVADSHSPLVAWIHPLHHPRRYHEGCVVYCVLPWHCSHGVCKETCRDLTVAVCSWFCCDSSCHPCRFGHQRLCCWYVPWLPHVCAGSVFPALLHGLHGVMAGLTPSGVCVEQLRTLAAAPPVTARRTATRPPTAVPTATGALRDACWCLQCGGVPTDGGVLCSHCDQPFYNATNSGTCELVCCPTCAVKCCTDDKQCQACT